MILEKNGVLNSFFLIMLST